MPFVTSGVAGFKRKKRKILSVWYKYSQNSSNIEINLPNYVFDILSNIQSIGGRALIVGGAVRDAILGKASKDIDFEVYRVSYEDLSNILNKYGKSDLVGKAFGVIKFVGPDGLDFDFSLPRTDSKSGVGHKDFDVTVSSDLTPSEAAGRRDFTINAISYDPLTHEIIDPYNGQIDLQNKVLRHISDSFADDPLRVLRGMNFVGRFSERVCDKCGNKMVLESKNGSNKYACSACGGSEFHYEGFSLAPETAELAKSIKDQYQHLPKERIEGDRHYVFFDPHQVKSAIGNSGLYDVNDADVTANNNHKNKKYSQYGQLAIPKIHIPEEYRNNFIKKHKELVRNTSDKHSIEYNPIPTASYWIIHPNGDIDLLKENHKPHMERVMDYISKNNNQLNEQPEDLIKSSAHEKIHHIFQGGIRVYAFIADTKSLVYITMFQIPTEQQKTAIHALFTEIEKRSVYITISADFEIFNNNTTNRINKNFVSIQAFESFVENLDRQIEKEPVATSDDIRNEPEFELQEQIQEKPAIEYDKSKMKSVLESMPIKQPQSLKYTGAKRLFKRTTV